MTRVNYPYPIHFRKTTLKAFKQANSLKVGRLLNIFCSYIFQFFHVIRFFLYQGLKNFHKSSIYHFH